MSLTSINKKIIEILTRPKIHQLAFKNEKMTFFSLVQEVRNVAYS